ncbi:MAG: hypothetical protein N2235_22020 [Fischerella sp.]|nr:hypothetical protein [Fischerella sp.]
MKKERTKSRLLFSAVLLLLVMVLSNTLPRLLRPKDRTPKIYYTLEKNGIVRFTDSDDFLASLEIVPTKLIPARKRQLMSVGQIVLLIEPPSVTTSGRLHPLHLDENYSRTLSLESLPWASGKAFGVSELATEYKIQPGIPLEVMRYGLLTAASNGIVRRVLKSPSENSRQLVIFEIPNGRNWYPGTNCRVIFPTLSEKPVVIPKRALLHIGDQDFVFLQNTASEFQLRAVTVFDETENTITVGGLRYGDKVLAKGSILLKNFIPELLRLEH